MSSNDETPNTQPSTSDLNKDDYSKAAGSSSEGNVNAGALEVAEEKVAALDECILLRVIYRDMSNEVHFQVKATTALGRLKCSYCSELGFQIEKLGFIFNGHRITDDDTPKSLGMMNGDVIEIYQEWTGPVDTYESINLI